MRRVGTALVTLVAISFVGCPFLKKKGDDGGTGDEAAPDAATVTVGGTGAKNEAAVLRYANETPLANAPGIIGKDGTHARNFPGNGPIVATLAKGTVVAKIAQYFSTGVLVMFDDPSGDGSKLLGWVVVNAFDIAAPPPTRTVVVPHPVVVDAGGTAIRDAGVAVVDAGGRAPAAVDAGAIPQPPPGVPAVAPVNGKCPTGFIISTGMCRRTCNVDADCPRGTKCVMKGAKVCSSS